MDEIRHSVSVLKTLPPEVQGLAREVYFEGLRYSFLASAGIALLALVSGFFARGRRLDRD